MMWLLLLQLTMGTYFRETIDSLRNTSHDKVVITGTIAVLSMGENGSLSFRMGDEHGHFVSCVLKKELGQPKLGIKFDIYGVLQKYVIPDKGQIMEIVVDKIEPVEKN